MASWKDTRVEEVSNARDDPQDQDKTWMASIQHARSSELMLLHSFLTSGLVQDLALTEVNKTAETTTARRMERKAILGLGMRGRAGDWGTALTV